MTNDKMDLHALVGKTADGDFLRDMIGFAAQRLMELEVGGATGAAYGEKDPERLAQRNGYRDRGLGDASRGRSSCGSPTAQGNIFFQGFLEPPPYGREGTDGRHPGSLYPGDLDPLCGRLVKAMGMSGISKSQVSRLCVEIDERVKAF
ncbi:hypothetical protein BF95_09480, partial [Sphingobium sp. Ant17]